MTDIEQCLALLSDLVAIRSESQQEKDIAVFLAKYFQRLGLPAELQKVEDNSYNVVARMKGGNGAKILYLGGHIDTVKSSRRWHTPPLSLVINGERAYGLGSGDMKGGLAAQICVLQRLLEDNFQFDGEIVFVGLADEERYSIGAEHFLAREKDYISVWPESNKLAIFAEPHFDEIVIGGSGKILLDICLTGQSGHAARPESGINAIIEASAFLVEVEKYFRPLYEKGTVGSYCALRMESEYNGYSLNIPDKCQILLNKQLNINEESKYFIDRLYGIYQEMNGRGGIVIEQKKPAYQSYQLNKALPQLTLLTNTIAKANLPRPQYQMMQAVSDANLFVPAGIPTILYGPKGIDIHKENEYVSIASMRQYIDVLYDFIAAYFN